MYSYDKHPQGTDNVLLKLHKDAIFTRSIIIIHNNYGPT